MIGSLCLDMVQKFLQGSELWPKMQFGIGILVQRAMSKGGYTSCRFFVVKNTLFCSLNLQPKCSLNARLGHSKFIRALKQIATFDRERYRITQSTN